MDGSEKNGSLLIVLLTIAVLGTLARGKHAFSQDEKIEFESEFDSENRVTKIFVPAEKGVVKLSDISTSLLKYAEIDLGEIELPDWIASSRSIDFSRFAARISLRATDIALGNGIDFEIDQASDRLIVKIHHDLLGARFRATKDRMRNLILGLDSDESWKRQFGLTLDEWIFPDDAERLKNEEMKERIVFSKKRLCIFVHGLNSRTSMMKPLAEMIKKEGFAVGYFDYPNDDKISRSAFLFSEELKKHQVRFPTQKISIIAHSMGGLVARNAIEDSRLDSGNVDQLIMICTPNQGSNLAKLAIGQDVWEHYAAGADVVPSLSRLKSSLADGVNEAATDLTPDSKFLSELNKLPRNKGVRYTSLLGNNGSINEDQVGALAKKIEKWSLDSKWVKLVTENGLKKIEDFTEIIEGKGDGVVAVEAAALKGVDDVKVFGVTHRSMWTSPKDESSIDLYRSVIDRLR